MTRTVLRRFDQFGRDITPKPPERPKVWLAWELQGYEGSELLGAFASREGAVAALPGGSTEVDACDPGVFELRGSGRIFAISAEEIQP